jgi:4-amino-4-deoxy-L-arabinose transferase-like glycosyltransferase
VKQHRRILYGILAAYVVLATLYSVVTPIFEASDELWHYPMVKYLADHGLGLPPQEPANPGPWRQEGSQPPLYYMMAAILTAGIDTSDMEYVRRINPHADIGIIRPDGNANMMVHRQPAEAFPWQGTTLAVHLIRFFSIALGLGTVLVTYQLAREIFLDWPLIALGAAALNAFLPMFLFISGSVNNDNLSNVLGNLLTLLIVRLVKTPDASSEAMQPRSKWLPYALIGVVTGAGLLAKLNIGFLIPLVGIALLVVSIRQRDWRPVVIGGATSGALTILIAGWWYLRNAQLYGDPTGLNMFLNMVGRRAVYANLPQLWSERHSFTQAYWGFFGGMNVALPEWVYLIFNVIGGVGLIGAVGFIGYWLIQKVDKASLVPTNVGFQWLPAIVTIIWPIITFVSYLRWTAETQASQGRLVFGSLSAISLWMAVGLVWWLPTRLQGVVMTGAAGYFAVVAALTPFLVIAPVYTPPTLIAGDTENSTLFWEQERGVVGFLDARIVTPTVQPEDYAMVEMDWQTLHATARDWSLFAHLVTADGVIIAQRDVYPGQGKIALSEFSENQISNEPRAWRNQTAIWIPATASAPTTLNVEVGWYDLQTGERLMLSNGEETLTIGQVELLPRNDIENLDVPNPIRVNFDNQIELVGYELSDLSPAASDTIELTLYWRATKPITQDYKIFANILDSQSLTKYAASDGMPVNWNAPTSTWTPGKIITDMHTLNVDPNTPPGIYETEIGWYLQAEDGSFPRLRIVTPDGGMADNFLNLSRVRVVPAEDNP